MRHATPRVTRGELALLAALVVWGLFPVVLLLIHAADTHTRLTGADGLIGADGELGGDQLQYLAWIRDASAHGLAADLFRLTDIRRVYLQPLFTISGGLYRLGCRCRSPTGVQAGRDRRARRRSGRVGAAHVRRPGGRARGDRRAVACFCRSRRPSCSAGRTPARAGSPFPLFLLGSELHGADKIWGYVPSAIALGLMPIALLATERALAPEAAGRPSRARRAGPLALAAGAALIASWLHPWQGITLILILAGLVALRRGRGATTLAAAAVAAALPLLYYYVLSHADPAWSLASTYEATRRAPAITLIVGFGPLALIAAPGLRRPRGEMIEQALLLWIAATFINYFLNDSFPPHAYQGLAFPFSVLAVRGFQRLRLPAVAGWVGGRAADDAGHGVGRAQARADVRQAAGPVLPPPRRRRRAALGHAPRAAGRGARADPVRVGDPVADRARGLGRQRLLEPRLPGAVQARQAAVPRPHAPDRGPVVRGRHRRPDPRRRLSATTPT